MFAIGRHDADTSGMLQAATIIVEILMGSHALVVKGSLWTARDAVGISARVFGLTYFLNRVSEAHARKFLCEALIFEINLICSSQSPRHMFSNVVLIVKIDDEYIHRCETTVPL